VKDFADVFDGDIDALIKTACSNQTIRITDREDIIVL
jgi:hypothetical protein